MDKSQHYIGETKNVKKQHLSTQLKDDINHVTRRGYPGRVDVFINKDTQINTPLLREHLNPGSPLKITVVDM